MVIAMGKNCLLSIKIARKIIVTTLMITWMIMIILTKTYLKWIIDNFFRVSLILSISIQHDVLRFWSNRYLNTLLRAAKGNMDHLYVHISTKTWWLSVRLNEANWTRASNEIIRKVDFCKVTKGDALFRIYTLQNKQTIFCVQISLNNGNFHSRLTNPTKTHNGSKFESEWLHY